MQGDFSYLTNISLWLGYDVRANREPSLIQRKHPQAEKAPLSYSSHTAAVGENSISNICSLHHHAISITALNSCQNAMRYHDESVMHYGAQQCFLLHGTDIRGCPVSTYYVRQFGAFAIFGNLLVFFYLPLLTE